MKKTPSPAAAEENIIGEAIKSARENIGWSQMRLAKESGVDRAALNEIEGGKPRRQNMTIDTIRKLAKALGVSPGDLVDGRIRRQRISEDELIEAILEEMDSKRMRRPELAERVGIPVTELSAILDGAKRSEMGELRPICDQLGIALNAPPRAAEITICQELMGGTLIAEGVIRLRSKK